MSKFSQKNLQAIVLRLIKEPYLIERFYTYLDPSEFTQNSQSIEKQGLRRLLEILLTYYKEKNLESLNRDSFAARVHTYSDGEINDEARLQLDKMYCDAYLEETSKNNGVLEIFLEVLQRNMVLSWFGEFKKRFLGEDVKSAVRCGREFFETVEQVRIADEADFDYKEVDSIFSSQAEISPENYLATGLLDLDNELGGGLETSTLSVGVAPPGVGKSQLASHLIQNCIEQKKYAHVTVVEDRKKTFLPRVLSGVCNIPINRLKKDFENLTVEEKSRFDKAVMEMRKYIKLDFLYDTSISEIHQRKKQWLMYCRANGLPCPVVDILDYSGHVATTASGDKTYEKYLAAYSARKNYCLKYGQIGIDFAQVNREGARKTDDVITKNDLASSFDIARVCDNIFTINRNDEQKLNNKCILYMAKLRDGATLDSNKFEIPTEFDYGRYNMANAVNLSRITTSISGDKK